MNGVEPSAAPHVVALKSLDTRGRRVRIALDDGTQFELALEAVERAGIGTGDPIDREVHAYLIEQDLRWRARDVALAFLAYRARSRDETRRRLLEDSFPAAVVESCLDELTAERLLDDDAFADMFVRDRIHLRPRGPARLRDDLRKKGIAQDAAAAAVDRGLESAGVTDESLAIGAAIRWLQGKGPRDRAALAAPAFSAERQGALRRLSFLQRRGFGSGAVRDAVAAVDASLRGETI